ncbi:MAG: FtsX-like permease family protein [Nocardioidaceae bacterium]|nr:FtsX-like permease family protein [Nocardioidaceae bacterium]
MRISQIFSELGTGLRRNVSMTISLVVTTFVSLTLVGFGVLVIMQTDKTEQFFGDRLQLQVTLCSDSSVAGTCLEGAVIPSQQEQIELALTQNPEVEGVRYQSAQQSYDKAKELFSQSPSTERVFEITRPDQFSAAFFVTLADPDNTNSVTAAMTGTPGVDNVLSLTEQLRPLYLTLTLLRNASLIIATLLVVAAIMQVSNTIRLAAYARRREIGIMRLVGASTWHIQLPFVLESLLAALVAGALACAALAAFMQFAIFDGVLDSRIATITDWIGWREAFIAGGSSLALGVLLALVPTLIMTRKYLDV